MRRMRKRSHAAVECRPGKAGLRFGCCRSGNMEGARYGFMQFLSGIRRSQLSNSGVSNTGSPFSRVTYRGRRMPDIQCTN